MTEDREYRFRPRLGKPRARGGKSAKRFINRVLKAAQKAGPPVRPGKARSSSSVRRNTGASARLAARGYGRCYAYTQGRSRRVVVKARVMKLADGGFAGLKEHLRYVQRDGVSKEGEGGLLYDETSDAVDGRAFAERCEEDRHYFRFIVSPEDELGDQKPFVRELVGTMERDLGTRLEWVAVDHFNTDNAHTHLIIRGKDERGQDLIIDREYISHGMRKRAAEIVTQEIGIRTEREIHEAMRREVEKDRLTSLDRRLIHEAEGQVVDMRLEPDDGARRFSRNMLVGRLQKLERMGLADESSQGIWRLSEEMEPTLRRLALRGDIIKTMHAEMSHQGIVHAEADYSIFDPTAEPRRIVGRIVGKGLSDELDHRYYVVVDGSDGKAHYVDIGHDQQFGELRTGAIVEVASRSNEPRPADRTIDEIARANDGGYSPELHRRFDPKASARFVQAHVRRLEALRRAGHARRLTDGSWDVPQDYLDRAAVYEAQQNRKRPVTLSIGSSWSIERQIEAEGATWLDRQLVGKEDMPLAPTGFGREISEALARRRTHLKTIGMAQESGAQTIYQRDLLRTLERRELSNAADQIALETSRAYKETKTGDRVEGVYRQRIELASGPFAVIEKSKEFRLVPWRPILERARDKSVAGLVRGNRISWDITRNRGLSIS